MIKKLSHNISSYLCNELNFDNQQREILSYGLQIFLGTSLKLVAILIISYLLNIFTTTLVVNISFIFFRRIIGGGHCDAYNKCCMLSVSLMLLLGFIGEKIIVPYSLLHILIIFTYFVSLFITVVWIPMGTEKKTINNKKTRLKIKCKTAGFLTIWLIFLLVYKEMSLVSFPSLLGIALAFFLATPLGSKFIQFKI